MNYIEVTIGQLNGYDPDIIVANLAELGFESFSETGEGIQAYITSEIYSEEETRFYLDTLSSEHGAVYSILKIEPENWNARWESEYQPVVVAGICRVRAPFHQSSGEFQYDIVIEPKMSFGTAHHETTALMIDFLLRENLDGKVMLDMGCGTGILAILGALKNAGMVTAIDTDDWAVENSLENISRNGCRNIEVIKGNASVIPDKQYDIIVANINRNVLLDDMKIYSMRLSESGVLLLSGFYESDLAAINQMANENNLELTGYSVTNNWVGVKFIK